MTAELWSTYPQGVSLSTTTVHTLYHSISYKPTPLPSQLPYSSSNPATLATLECCADYRLVGNALELGFIELLSECFTLSEQAGVGSDKLMELIKDQHKSPALLRYADRITVNRFDSKGGFNLAGGIADARWVFFSSFFFPSSLLGFPDSFRYLLPWYLRGNDFDGCILPCQVASSPLDPESRSSFFSALIPLFTARQHPYPNHTSSESTTPTLALPG